MGIGTTLKWLSWRTGFISLVCFIGAEWHKTLLLLVLPWSVLFLAVASLSTHNASSKHAQRVCLCDLDLYGSRGKKKPRRFMHGGVMLVLLALVAALFVVHCVVACFNFRVWVIRAWSVALAFPMVARVMRSMRQLKEVLPHARKEHARRVNEWMEANCPAVINQRYCFLLFAFGTRFPKDIRRIIYSKLVSDEYPAPLRFPNCTFLLKRPVKHSVSDCTVTVSAGHVGQPIRVRVLSAPVAGMHRLLSFVAHVGAADYFCVGPVDTRAGNASYVVFPSPAEKERFVRLFRLRVEGEPW